MFGDVILLSLIPAALFLAAPMLSDLGAVVRCLRRLGRPRPPAARDASFPRLLFLVPAHDEEELIARTVRSLLSQKYPADHVGVYVVADNCRDRTAARAREAGARVLERDEPGRGGKHAAIGWALDRLPLEAYAAVVIIDADTEVGPEFSEYLRRRGPLERALIQTRVGASNEDENWLTRLSALLTVSRWDLALPLKTGAGLNCPLTGDGSVLGSEILQEYPWEVRTITEGWELYARFTTAGLKIDYVPEARLYAQEARELGQSRSQRERWTAGRFAVLRRYARSILTTPGIGALQRLDLIAELSSPGPVMKGFLGCLGALLALATGAEGAVPVALLFLGPVVQIGLYAGLSVPLMPDPAAVLRAAAMLPIYAVWRVGVGFRSIFQTGTSRWVRTARHDERRHVGPVTGRH